MPDFFNLQYFDLQSFLISFGGNPLSVFLFLFLNGGVFIVFIIIVVYGITGWKRYIMERQKRIRKYVVLKLSIPKENEQSMKAVEKIFVALKGAANTPTFTEAWWDGWIQESFSFEIASINGSISFYVHTPEYFRDLIESAIYAQYPDAEIVEVEDYAKDITPEMIEKKKVKIWGAEMQLRFDDWYPIKTYDRFEHQLTGRYIDPMAGILEVMSRLEPGEQFWYQILITPLHPKEWQNFKIKANKFILKVASRDKLYGKTYAAKKSVLDHVMDAPIKTLEIAGEQVFGPATSDAQVGDTMDKSLYLVKPEQDLVTAVDSKNSQVIHKAKIRFVYVARTDLFDEFKGRRAMLGALDQFNGPNWLDPGVRTQINIQNYPFYGAEYIFPKYRVKRRQIKILRAYKIRDWQRGENFGHIYAVDELASLYHFPVLEVRAPFVTMAETKRVEPPFQLNINAGNEIPIPVEEGAEPPEVIEEQHQEKIPDNVVTGIPVSAFPQPLPEQIPPAQPPLPVQAPPAQPQAQPQPQEQNKNAGAPPPNLPVV
ncbi:hypothetical protein KKC88_05125 [Patescibacteria group bacterium]|nr:hypothetical protein [Patescibacteria group bacterium]MBU1673709.1 hypothetical protein [Patescibacteria group bacterium]MBU1963061.1 hypothetical protein [Patescibacteria group bacterium]